MKRLFLLSAIIAVCASCTNSVSDDTNYVPFQRNDNGKWGMISLQTGEVLFDEKFSNEPTIVASNRFFVKNDKGLWELYTAEKEPNKIGTEYICATSFKNGKAIVSEDGNPIKIIDQEANTIKELDKIDGQSVLCVWPFSDGYAIYKTKRGYGLIDEEGNPIIKPDFCKMFPYSNNRVIAIENKYADDFKIGKTNVIKYSVLDGKGTKVFEIDGSKFSFNLVYPMFFDGKTTVVQRNNSERTKECLLDDSGNTISIQSDKFNSIEDHEGDMIIYRYGGACGLMNVDGNIKIRPQYAGLSFYTPNTLIACVSDNQKQFYKLIDIEGNEIMKETFDDIASLNYLERFEKNLFVKNADKWHIIDIVGKEVATATTISNVSVSEGDEYVESGLIDTSTLLSEMGLIDSAEKFDPNTLKDAAKILYVLNKYPATSSYDLKQALFKEGFGVVEEKHNFVYEGYILESSKDNTDQLIKIERDSVSVGYDFGYFNNKEIKWSMKVSPRNAIKLLDVIVAQTLKLLNNAHVGYSLEEGWDKVDSFSNFTPHNTYSVQSKIGRIEFEINGIDDTSLNITYTPNYRFE